MSASPGCHWQRLLLQAQSSAAHVEPFCSGSPTSSQQTGLCNATAQQQDHGHLWRTAQVTIISAFPRALMQKSTCISILFFKLKTLVLVHLHLNTLFLVLCTMYMYYVLKWTYTLSRTQAKHGVLNSRNCLSSIARTNSDFNSLFLLTISSESPQI